MKYIFIFLMTVLLASQINAQIVYDEKNRIVLFSQIEENRTLFKNIEKLIIPAFDNDSLCKVYNNGKSLSELENLYTGGFQYDQSPFDIKSRSTKINIAQGTIWTYSIESSTAAYIGIQIENFQLPQGAYFSIIADENSYIKQKPIIYETNNIPVRIKENGLNKMVFGKNLTIEYFEPNIVSFDNKLIINSISYGFVGIGKKKIQVKNLHY